LKKFTNVVFSIIFSFSLLAGLVEEIDLISNIRQQTLFTRCTAPVRGIAHCARLPGNKIIKGNRILEYRILLQYNDKEKANSLSAKKRKKAPA
jgi:hypothetical protein